MERNGDSIIFSSKEQADFSQPPIVSIEIALDTATAFMRAAGVLDGCATEDVIRYEGVPGTVTDSSLRGKQVRAAGLSGFASGIFDLCPTEHLARIASSQKGL